ncbi:hypothetical protein JCM8097_002320 [Rhodosporidiobolus ruineniae]
MPPQTNSVLSTTLALVALQVSSRLFSFALNQLLLRSTSPQAFGLATIQLDTLIGTVLFLLREGVRGAVVRTRSSSTAAGSRLLRQSLLIPTLLSPLAVLAFAAYRRYSTPSLPPSQYLPTLALYLASTLIELFFEPLYLRTLQNWEQLTTGRVRVEGAATLVKALAMLAVVRSVREEDALIAFGAGQFVYSATIWAGLVWVTRGHGAAQPQETEEKGGWAPLQKVEGRYFDPEVTRLGWALTKQSVVKQLLTEGDKLAVGRFGSREDMGGYAVALNYGSLVARVLCLPLEESSRLYFSSLSASSSDDPDSKSAKSSTSSTSPRYPPLSALSSAATYLRTLLLLHTHLALIFFLLAPSFTTPLLHLLLGPTWAATAGPTLRAYAASLPFLGFNGLTEAFFQSVASPAWIAKGSAWMAVCAAAFAGSVAVLSGYLGLGARGLVGANCVNMALRTGFSTTFIRSYFGEALSATAGNEGEKQRVRDELGWRAWTPNKATVLAFVGAGWVVRASEGRWASRMLLEGGKAGRGAALRATAEHIGVGAVVGVGCLTVVLTCPIASVLTRVLLRVLVPPSPPPPVASPRMHSYLTRRAELRALVSSARGGPGKAEGRKKNQ